MIDIMVAKIRRKVESNTIVVRNEKKIATDVGMINIAHPPTSCCVIELIVFHSLKVF